MRRHLLAITILTANFTHALAADKSYLLHNGSEIVSVLEGTAASIYYAKPKASLKGIVDDGTLLFRGEIKDGRIKGTAFAFRKGCAPTPYSVEGLTPKGDVGFELTGPGPVFRPGCKTEGTSWKSPHSRLVFSYDNRHNN